MDWSLRMSNFTSPSALRGPGSWTIMPSRRTMLLRAR
jgi:hypothetical protein